MDLGIRLLREWFLKEGCPQTLFNPIKKDHMLVFLLDKILDKALKISQNKFYNSVFNVKSTVVVIWLNINNRGDEP